MERDTNYYDQEAERYSQKRYPKKDSDFVHFSFKKRKDILIEILGDIIPTHKNTLSLLEMGCADGIVTREIAERFPQLHLVVGSDISQEMIRVAREGTADPRIDFVVRGERSLGIFDIIVEVGVISGPIARDEVSFAYEHLSSGGSFICSIANRRSFRAIFKEQSSLLPSYMTFSEFEELFPSRFSIVQSKSFGLFVPYLWKFPFIGRFFQPFFEFAFLPFLSLFYHERIYCLRKTSAAASDEKQ
jgi:SAM-dependent methyltransferase